jgi:hypothetical protein
MKAATVYRKGDTLFSHAMSRTTVGVWIATPPFTATSMNENASLKGVALLRALEGSRPSVPHPTKWNELLKPLLQLAGTKSWRRFVENNKCLNVEAEGALLKLIPTRNLGAEDGFEPVPEECVILSFSSSPEEIGSILQQLLQ